jgi:transcriptional regulator with XRE-family HTH domain
MTKKLVVDKKVFALRLKDLMEEFNETVYSIAEVVHLTAPTISRYLGAEMAAKITTIEVLARYFNVNPVWLMGGSVPREIEEEKKHPNTIAAHLPEGVSLTEEEQESLDEYIKFLLSRREK